MEEEQKHLAAPQSDTPLEVIFLTEQRDEAAIINEMRGGIVDTYVYSFQQGNRVITNLASPGVKEAIRRRGNVAIIQCGCCNRHAHVDEVNGEYRATVKIHDLKNNVQFLGTSTCKTNQPFAYVLAVNKAERNAFRKVLPEKEIALLIKEWGKLASEQPMPVPQSTVSEASSTETTPLTPSADPSPTIANLYPSKLEEALGWRRDRTGKGEWNRAVEMPELKTHLNRCKDKTDVIGSYRYKLWGSADDMISRWPHKEVSK